MNLRTVLFTANAGFFLTVNHITVAVDAFPRMAHRGFSALREEHLSLLCDRADLQSTRYVIATHDHGDHYSARWTKRFMDSHPQARFIGAVSEDRTPFAPETSNAILLRSDHPTYYLPGITLEFRYLPHEGAEFARVINYGCLLTFTGSPSTAHSRPCRVLFLGDAKPADPAIAGWIAGRSVDLALLNFPWITLPKGRRFLKDHLPHAQIVILHLPYETEDRNHYLEAARKAAGHCSSHPLTLLTEFGQTFHF